jgi:hypothetical protein
MKGITIQFKNKPNEQGDMLTNHKIHNCLIAQSGGPAVARPQVIVHLPKDDPTNVEGAWFQYESNTYHVIGETVAGIEENVPTRWNRYVVAEKIY